MALEQTIPDKIQYCIDVIVKEAPQEERLVKQIFFAMLSAYSNRPINLAINAPSGEGKTHVLHKVGEKLPDNDVMFLAGMTDKALFHRNGTLVVKSECTGAYEPLEDQLAVIDEQIRDKESEILTSKNRDLRSALQHQITDLEKSKKELTKNTKKLIDLSYKTLVFIDTPRQELFVGLMPLLSHDKYEIEYENTDSNNGIKTRTNILRGWPAVIFAQAIDNSYYQRWPEIKRRFIFVNPKMDKVKYDAAIHNMADKFGLPDFAYQAKVVSLEQKNIVKSIMEDLAEDMIELSKRTDPDKNNVTIPFIESVQNSLPRDKAFDMTTANRFFTYLVVLPLINFEKRPRFVHRDLSNPLFIEIIPIATFEDLKEAMYLMEYGNGVKPFLMEWYNEVYLPTYNELTEPNWRIDSNNKKFVDGTLVERVITERRIGLSAKQLAEATLQSQNRNLSEKQIRDNYLKSLFNENIIDICDSECDRRSYISFPIMTTKISKYTYGDITTHNPTRMKINVIDSSTFPRNRYLNLWIWGCDELRGTIWICDKNNFS